MEKNIILEEEGNESESSGLIHEDTVLIEWSTIYSIFIRLHKRERDGLGH